MTLKELHNELLEAYSVNNLNTISLTLINLFKNQQFTVLQKISDIIRDYTDVRISNDGKGFSRFMMLYHPDRAMFHVTEINKLAAENNYDDLLKYAHILKLESINEIAATIDSFDDIDYSPVYDWDMSDLADEGFRIFDLNDLSERGNDPAERVKPGMVHESSCSFFDALKIRDFGDPEADFPLDYLEEMEELEMSSFGINELDGIQFCIHVRTIDLSNNMISDLFPLMGLKEIEDLDLSDNEIGFIDDIGNLKRLKSVILANNYIEDISPLFELDDLEYVDLAGNKIDPGQIDTLFEMGVTVNF